MKPPCFRPLILAPVAVCCLSLSAAQPQADNKSELGRSRVVPLPRELPEESTPLGDVPQAGVAFTTSDARLKRLHDAAETVCRGNVVRYPSPLDMDILIEGSGYNGAWLETQPMGGHMWGKRDLRIARNNR